MSRELSRSEIASSLVVVGLAFAALAGGHEEWVRAAIVITLATSILVEPLLVFAHELGHAVAAVALTGQRVLIRMGGEPYAVRFALGKIDVRFDPRGYVAHCELSLTRMSRLHQLVVALAGPAASLAVGAALVPLALAWRGDADVLFWVTALAAASALFVGVANALPFRRLPSWWPGSLRTDDEGPSDGWFALRALRPHRDREECAWPGEPQHEPTCTSDPATERARRVIAGAVQEAYALGSHHLGTEHVLLGLLRETGSAAGVLESFGLTAERVRAQIARAVGTSEGTPPGELPITPAARRTFDRAHRALSLRGDDSVDAEHILLGLVQEREGLATAMMAELGVDPSDVRRQAILSLHAGTGTAPRAPSGLSGSSGSSAAEQPV